MVWVKCVWILGNLLENIRINADIFNHLIFLKRRNCIFNIIVNVRSRKIKIRLYKIQIVI